MLLNTREFKNFYKSLNIGDNFYLNILGVNENVIDLLQEYIQLDKIAPLESELIKMVKKENINKFLSGEIIAPQMTYIKIS